MIKKRFEGYPYGLVALGIISLFATIWAGFSALSVFDPYDGLKYVLFLSLLVTISSLFMERKNLANSCSNEYSSMVSAMLIAMILTPLYSFWTLRRYNIFKLFVPNQSDKLATVLIFAAYVFLILAAITIFEANIQKRPFGATPNEISILDMYSKVLWPLCTVVTEFLVLNALSRFTTIGARILYSDDPFHYFLEILFTAFITVIIGRISLNATIWDFLSDLLVTIISASIFAALTYRSYNIFGLFYYEGSYFEKTVLYAAIYYIINYFFASSIKLKVWIYEGSAIEET